MRTNLLAAAFAALLSLPAFAQVDVKISFPWLAPPPLVVVEPGIQVVPDYPEEVFFVDSWYWVRRDGRWLRARDYRAGWNYVAAPPAALIRLPPGKYKHWKAAERREDRREDRREEKREERREERRDDGRRVTAPPARGGRVVEAPPADHDEGRRVEAPPGHGGGKGHGKK